jgi:hypothetical protein
VDPAATWGLSGGAAASILLGVVSASEKTATSEGLCGRCCGNALVDRRSASLYCLPASVRALFLASFFTAAFCACARGHKLRYRARVSAQLEHHTVYVLDLARAHCGT